MKNDDDLRVDLYCCMYEWFVCVYLVHYLVISQPIQVQFIIKANDCIIVFFVFDFIIYIFI